ncbi:MAG TPA: NAD(+)/NADH kinase [Candidatus Cybelea sp.]|nr:NAD(+)/NADH kinase [Candidatus Cybelea sp.]
MKKLAQKIKRVGLIGNTDKPSCRNVIAEAARLVARSGRRVYTDAGTARMAGLTSNIHPNAASVTRAVDLVLVFGGDGTMLRIAREAAGLRTPILGINIGGLGFLTDVSSPEMAKALKQVWKGEFQLESRPLIEATGTCQGQPVRTCALNDFVISRGIVSRLITLEVSVDNELVTQYRCDGLIISSPTGSTAYSLSAGGAVVHPQADVCAITPICPHTLSNRSLIVSMKSTIRVKVVSPRPETTLSADGCHISDLDTGDVITVRRSRDSIRLMHLAHSSFFATLRQKLHWSGTSV